MKKLQVPIFIFLILLSIFLFASSQAIKAAGSSTVSVPTLNPSSSITLGGYVTAKVIVGGISGTPTGTITFQYSMIAVQLGILLDPSKRCQKYRDLRALRSNYGWKFLSHTGSV